MKKRVIKLFGLYKIVNLWKSLIVLLTGLILTLLVTFLSLRRMEKSAMEELTSISMEISLKIDARLHAHALILRSGTAHFAVSDTVTRDEWKEFVELSRLDINLPGIQGVGYSVIIPPDELEGHINHIRQEGFPDYTVLPEGERDIYTSIVYLEPFTGRNLRAFGFDMYSEPVRRKAMQLSRDNNLAILTGKVNLVQETGEDIQAGTLMYVPLYDKEMPANTVEERREAIRGWVYSPYRMRDLMKGILGRFDEEHQDRVRLQIYDESISDSSLLYDSQYLNETDEKDTKLRKMILPVEFNGTKWLLSFSQVRGLSIFNFEVLVLFISGLIISILLFLLSLSYFKIRYRSKQIRKQNEELQILNATKDKFFAIIAHDLKSPFNSIIGFSKILIDQVEQKRFDGIARFAEIIHQSSNVAMDLLMNLMQWSQSQTGRLEFSPEKFRLLELMNSILMLFTDNASLKSIKIRNEVPEHIIVYGDYDMVNTVLRNLISNAIKFTHPGGEIVVKAEENSHGHIISVTDTGIGIPAGKIDKLFRIDESYSTTGTHKEKGTGLGLVLCKEFVEKHGGKIWVESKAGKNADDTSGGTTFYFTLPAENSASKKNTYNLT